MGAMDPEKYEVVPIGITKQGQWLASGDPMAQLRAGVDPESVPKLSSVLAPDPTGEGRGELVQLAPSSDGSLTVAANVSQPLDVIFPVLHGPYGEDGSVQGAIELAGIPYVGSGVLGSAVGMDKDVMKNVFIAHGLPVAPFVCVLRSVWAQD